MGREYAREFSRDCIDYMRVSIYPVRRNATGKRGKRNKPTSDVMARHNYNVSVNNLTDHVNLNFSPSYWCYCFICIFFSILFYKFF